jgi:pyruvate/2-oxoglutarate dehydrogenase complex dihydrolipoamide acyltransferase (E2) component
LFRSSCICLVILSAQASADALRTVPAVNAVIDGDEIVYRDYCDISVAVSAPKGLVVPVLRGADRMSFADVEKTINALVSEGRRKGRKEGYRWKKADDCERKKE